jgi:hypothetical protein
VGVMTGSRLKEHFCFLIYYMRKFKIQKAEHARPVYYACNHIPINNFFNFLNGTLVVPMRKTDLMGHSKYIHT